GDGLSPFLVAEAPYFMKHLYGSPKSGFIRHTHSGAVTTMIGFISHFLTAINVSALNGSAHESLKLASSLLLSDQPSVVGLHIGPTSGF
ncbi:hypothetical protein JWR97_25820, partial [Pseudomonas cedrina subsp. fulgida]|nr:hypothetical protein [Pseudomonas cedrina subsp. fulgida]